jgi:putative transposase
LTLPLRERRARIEPDHPSLSVRRQCVLLGLSRSTYYYEPARETEENLQENLRLMRLIDAEYLRHPFYGTRKMTNYLRDEGYSVTRKRVGRLMRLMGLEAIYPKPKTSQSERTHQVYPYLLREVVITAPCQVWSSDITYVPVRGGYMYLVAVIDWFSRFVVAWRLSNTLDGQFCIEVLEEALAKARPAIFNTDQGCQFTSHAFTSVLEQAGVRISMDGRGRALDNVFVERLWRSVKYEDVYLKDYADGRALEAGLSAYLRFYNHERFHQALNYRTPAQVHYETAIA